MLTISYSSVKRSLSQDGILAIVNESRREIPWAVLVLLALSVPLLAQPPLADPAPPPADPERWNLFYQATSIGDYHGTFTSPYEGPFSLQDAPERDVSITTTLFFALRLEQNTVLVFDPEIAGGRGFSGVNGLANPANGGTPSRRLNDDL